MDLVGTVALVTGGAVRVGRAIALTLAEAGCDVAVHYHASADAAADVVRRVAALGRRAVAVQGDLHDGDAPRAVIERTIAELGRLDVLVNNAAVFERMTLDGFDLAAWDRTLRINLSAPAALAHHARPHLEAAGRGRIVNLCDAGTPRPWSSHLAYCVSKAGLECLTRALAKAMAPKVLVNAVAPGIAEFPESYDEPTRRRLIAQVPLARAGTPQDVARAVRFLVESDYVTGQIISVDGGRSIA